MEGFLFNFKKYKLFTLDDATKVIGLVTIRLKKQPYLWSKIKHSDTQKKSLNFRITIPDK